MASESISEPDESKKGPRGKEKNFSPRGQSGKPSRARWLKDYVIPKVKTNNDRYDDDDDSASDPYEDEDEYSDEDERSPSYEYDHDGDEKSGTDTPNSDDGGGFSESDGETAESHKRFDPNELDQGYKLDKSKEKYAARFFRTHMTDDKLNKTVLEAAPVPANSFLVPPELDDYMEDLIGDRKAFRFLKMQDISLKYIQKKVSNSMGPLSQIWEELDGYQEGATSKMTVPELAELVEKTIVVIGQINTACLYERRLNFLAKIMKSVKNAKKAIRDHETEFDGMERLFGNDFYKTLERKVKNRKRAREMARDMGPPAKRPFRGGPSGRSSSQTRSHGQKSSFPRGSGSSSRGGSRNQSSRGRGRGNSDRAPRYVCQLKSKLYGYPKSKQSRDTNSIGTNKKNRTRVQQSASNVSRFGHDKSPPKQSPFRGSYNTLCSKLDQINIRQVCFAECTRSQNRIQKLSCAKQGSKSQSLVRKRPQGPRSRNTGNVTKERSRKGQNTEIGQQAVFQYFVCPPKERRGVKTHFQFEKTEQFYSLRAFQNGGLSYDKKYLETKRFPLQNRSEGCILLHSYTPNSQTLPKVQVGGSGDAVQKPSLRFGVGSTPVHQAHETSGCNSSKVGGQIDHIPRRHSSHEPIQGGSDKRSRLPFVPITQSRMADKLEQISIATNPEIRVLGNGGGLDEHDGVAASGQNRKDNQKVSKCHSIRPNYDSRVGKFNWVIECNCGGSDACCTVCKGTTDASNKVFTEISKLPCKNNFTRGMQKGNPLVDPEITRLEWEGNFSTLPRFDNRDRCLTERVGVPLPISRNAHGGTMEPSRTKTPYKCTGNDGSRKCPENPTRGKGKHSCSLKNGQYDGLDIHKQNGGDKVIRSYSDSEENLGILPPEKGQTDSGTHSRGPKRNCGLGKQECVAYEHKQLEIEQRDFQPNKKGKGPPGPRSVCRQTECSDTSLHKLETRPQCSGYGCFSHKLEGEKCLCIPPILHDTKMPCQSAEGGGRLSNNNPSMAESTILPSAPGNVCRLSNTAAPSDGSVTSPGGTTAPTNSKRDSKISGVENLRRSTEMQGFSTKASELLMSAWRKGTQSAYNCCWKQWHSWCDKRKIDPFCASLEHITNFLAELYEQGYEYRTINNYRSAISAFHPEIGGMKVGQTNTIKQLMTGIFNSKPPLPRYTETWDVDQVLKHLVNLEENNSLSLKVLSHKLVTLMALTSASRSSELHKLDTRFMQVSQKEVVFTITGLNCH